MNAPQHHSRWRAFIVLFLAASALLAPSVAAQKANQYLVTVLASDIEDNDPNTVLDPQLINGWGIAATATSPWWISAADTSTALLYSGAGVKNALEVSVASHPTGIVAYGGTGFQVTNGTTTAASRFIFATEEGAILGWNPTVTPNTQARVGYTSPDASSYKGLAVARTANGDFLYAADFHNARVDVISSTFDLVDAPGAFVDPDLPAGYAPFGIQNINDRIFVTYAKQDETAEDEVVGAGLGFVSVFDTAGAFLARVASRGALNAPWGVALAPANFGRFSGDLLIGNFGDGRINAYDAETFEARGHLKLANQRPLVIDGLWGIGFGNNAQSGPANVLYFAAGPEDETHGLFGKVEAQ